MKIYNSIYDFPKIKSAVLTVGTFDGVHLGHKKIIERLTRAASDLGGESVILTFFPHPRMVLYPQDNSLKLLTSIEEKSALLEKAGVDHLIVHPFTKDFSRLSAMEFIRDLMVNTLGMKKIVIGYNHQFGRNREGTFDQLMEMSPIHKFAVEEIPEQDVNQLAISSTKIRNALLVGDVDTANALLGYDYFIDGIVVKGDEIGKQLGYPTANLSVLGEYKLIPADGIYAVRVRVAEKQYEGMLYIGKRPIFNGSDLRIEVNIFNFNESIYDDTIRVSLVKKIRDDMNFSNLELLKNQLKKDEMMVQEAFRFLSK